MQGAKQPCYITGKKYFWGLPYLRCHLGKIKRELCRFNLARISLFTRTRIETKKSKMECPMLMTYFVSWMFVQLEKRVITSKFFLRWHLHSFLPVVVIQLKQFNRSFVHLFNVKVCIKSLRKAFSFCIFT